MLWPNVETFIGCDTPYQEAEIVMFGAPFDSTTSFRPGARFGPRAIRGDSFGIETYSPYQNKDLLDCAVMDAGDLELPFGDPEPVVKSIRAQTASILADGKRPFLIGGEHLVTLGAVQAVAAQYHDLHIIHFDAHADLRQDYLGTKLSHACVMRRCWEILGNGRIFQFGIRSGDKSEFQWIDEGHVTTRRFEFGGLRQTMENLRGKPIYFTIDLDVLDPSIFCGTGTPEAGGVEFFYLMEALKCVCTGQNIVAADVCELAPQYDQSGVSTAVACKIIRELLLYLQ